MEGKMKVKELIKHLQFFDGNKEIAVFVECKNENFGEICDLNAIDGLCLNGNCVMICIKAENLKPWE